MTRSNLQNTRLPDAPGVYTFVGAKGKPLYIGKATSLRDRVRSYFGRDLKEARGPWVAQMVEEARAVRFEKTDSVLEALILEANRIRKHKPKYNTLGKDDKTFNNVIITDEDFPRVLLVRGKDLAEIEAGKTVRGLSKRDIKYLYGPFPQGGALKEALRIVRKIFPHRDRCAPCPIENSFQSEGQNRSTKAYFGLKTVFNQNQESALGGRGEKGVGRRCRPCFNAQIGLCPGVCDGRISKQEYRRVAQNIRLFFDGKKKQLLQKLEREMKHAAQREAFEQAARLRKAIFALTHIRDVALIKRVHETANRRKPFRIEAYDVAHLSGGNVVGVMTVVEDSEAKKSDYRKFRIRGGTGNNDVAALREVLSRRLGHDEWPSASLIVVDGGTAQKNAAERVLGDHYAMSGAPIPVVGVVKNERHKPERIIGDDKLVAAHEKDILFANSEAHRFAITYHRQRRRHA